MGKFTEVKIDRKTLPPDGSVVEYYVFDCEGVDNGKRYGVFNEKEDMFWSTPSEFHFSQDVDKWRTIEEQKK